MKREIVEKAEQVIFDRHKQNQDEFEAKMATLKNNSHYQNLEKEYQSLLIENSRKEVYGEKVDRTKELALKKKIDEMLKDRKIPTSPKFNCTKCQDTGYVNSEMCTCLKKEVSNILLEESNFGKLTTFSEAEKNVDGNLKKLYEKMKDWCHSDFKKNLIFISGQVGVGKTHLTKAIANELIGKGKIVKLATAFQMSRDFKEYRSTYNENILDKYLSPEFLFIDDLGTETIYKGSTIEFLFQVINERKIKKLCTIITSNLMLDEIRDRYDERIFSRIADRDTSISILLTGNDLRFNK